jgi:hypothetical protein
VLLVSFAHKSFSLLSMNNPKSGLTISLGTPNLNVAGTSTPVQVILSASGREYGSLSSYPLMSSATYSASAALRLKIVFESTDLTAGNVRLLLSSPGVGLYPTMSLKPAGTRPEPAVSVP